MTLSIYQASVPVFQRMLGNLADILEKAERWTQEGAMSASDLLDARLAPDMHPLVRQVQIATDSVKGCVARLAGVEIPSFPDTESSLAELRQRLDRTQAFIASFEPSQLDGSGDKAIVLNFPGVELKYSGRDYLLNFVLPNFYFHVTTAYAILRHKGLQIGKMDYLGRP
ncbi:DUF1993 domain-containing protein [Stutzerimonas nosocomialis]|uniref:DUF1993 domain-containing protein n=1 Tax=Stutzerimonas nosocomialis TaxID=1056496 RepID=A0A5R9QAE1_9GAMM|nr:DUF1993 domain-containing protein [Stutzerimonas nosocomialis]TLX53960.1 DUF1993 domain-containing protein [Stutzerimonas nosocomialis]TLX56781.1 DUF1993 domain-containing protein [Stutzerimonas nosocomialis]TLX62086.1 DUF1993 domain-containing protein [Stutzerimonas nosocomialis]